jgi:hypothetical protein
MGLAHSVMVCSEELQGLVFDQSIESFISGSDGQGHVIEFYKYLVACSAGIERDFE